MKKTAFVFSGQYLNHRTRFHPETSARLSAIINQLKQDGLWPRLAHLTPRPATLDALAQIHSREHIRHVESACRQQAHYLDQDTMISRESYQIARLAAGGVLVAIDGIMSAEIENAFCALRPPGHHAEHSRAMGFCLFNNIAVAARYAQRKHGLKRILIIDWDAHHGNGTQNAFYADPTVFYCSLHQFPHYPGSGTAQEIGQGPGKGFTLNLPMPAGAGDAEYIQAMSASLVPAANEFSPDLVLISAGFDAHQADPLSALNVTNQGFSELTKIVMRIADTNCDGRLISVLEGGYDLQALGEAVAAHLKALLS